MIRFIHLADVHLGAVPDRGCPWSRERGRRNLGNIPPGNCSNTQKPGGFAIYSRRSLSPTAAFE